jgi:hypothetical protein
MRCWVGNTHQTFPCSFLTLAIPESRIKTLEGISGAGDSLCNQSPVQSFCLQGRIDIQLGA